MYKFNYYITDEDDNEVLGGSVILDESFEPVDEELGKAERRFKNYLLEVEADRQIQQAEEKGSEDGVDQWQN